MNIASKQIDVQLPYKRRLAYVESTGMQFIDIGIARRNTYRYVVDFRLTSILSSYRCIIGNQIDAGYNRFILRSYNGWFCSYGLPSGRANIISSDTIRHKWIVDMPNGYEEIDSSAHRHTFNSSQCKSPLETADTLFRLAKQGEWINMELYGFSISENDSDIVNLVPVMSLDDEPCMYDEVSGKLFKNAGTGTFGYGELTSGGDMK